MPYAPPMTLAAEAALPGGGCLRLEFGTPETMRLRVTAAARFQDVPSYAVVRAKWPEVALRVETGADGTVRIDTGALRVRFRAEPFEMVVEDRGGITRFEAVKGSLKIGGRSITVSRKLDEGEFLYGLGCQGEILNRNPGRFRIWNADDPMHQPHKQYYCTIPFGLSMSSGATGPHAFLVDNPGDVLVDAGHGARGEMRIETATGDLDVYLFFEDTPAALIEQYTELTGRMARPPMWALGYQQCRWSYPTAARVEEVAGEFRKRRIPCDVIYMDIDYMQDYLVFTWSDERFPDHEAVLARLTTAGFSPLCIIDPGVGIKPGYFAYDEGIREPWFFLRAPDGQPIIERVWPGDVHHPDFTHPAVRERWSRWQGEHLLAKGIAGVWNDMNEPAIFGATTHTKFYRPEAAQHDEGHFRTHGEIHNVYGHTMAQASCEGQLLHDPQKRPFTLTRSGWAGTQRYSSVWTGDNRSAWTCMPIDIQLMLNMGVSGVAFVGCDIGGFQNDATPELFARWMEWGVFQPFCRAHSAMGTIDQEPWAFGPAVEQVCRRMIELRYQLLPYIYTAFVEAAETGLPVARPLFLEYPTDATLFGIGDEFLLGSDLLVAPVLEPGKDRRALYLPPGEWVHYWSGARHDGARWVLVEAPFGQPPLFVRAGAVIPMHPIRQHTNEPEPRVTFLDVFPGHALTGRLVEDDGETNAWQRGIESRVVFSGSESANGLNLIIGAPQGPHRSAREEWVVRLHRGDRPITAITCNASSVEFDQGRLMTTFRIPDHRRAASVVVSYGA